ncbi:MAG: DEAD/DEAH box helicase [Candidatus Hydrogenedentes bacterium]|nr:DEAD/DEAH box helicase [Candidatus Hydrogenedentota bacterium]
MKMTELLRYDIPPEIIALWQKQESESLLPLQEMAVKRHNLFGGGNLIIQAPTSSGKTFIGEMAAIQTALRRKKVLYLVPLKALAEEKYEDFRAKYSEYGIDVIISTRDHRHFDEALESGRFSIAVAVYEKLSQMIVRRPERLEEVELVVADELEILSDPERGAQAELLLTRLLQSKRRLIGLSAVIGHADKLAKWMGADLVHHDRRPVELRYGVLHNGVFKYRTYNEYAETQEDFVNAHSESAWEELTTNLCEFVKRDETCLVFVKARHESRRGAELLAGRVALPPAKHALEALRRLEATHSRDSLLNTLASGVAFHNADLSREERLIVEAGFRSGEIKAVVATSTLAIGLNLPAHNVFMASDKWRYDSRFGMPWKTPVLRSEYENMGGRAGRYGSGAPFGRSILIAMTPFDQATLWRRYIEGERERVEPQLARDPLENHVLRLVASRACFTEEELQTFLENTLTGVWIWAETYTIDEIEFRIRSAVNRAVDAGMLAKDASGRLSATPFGQAVAAKGITIATALELAHWVRESETRVWSELDLILAAAMTPDGRMVQISLTSREYERADYPGVLKRLTLDEDLSADVPMNRLRNCSLTPFFEEVRAIKIALFLMDWIDELPIYEIEDRYHTFFGQIVAAADQLSWLVDTTSAIAGAFGGNREFIDRIARLSERLQNGLREAALPLARLRLHGLTRNAILALEAHNLLEPRTIASAPAQVLAQWMPTTTAHDLRSWALCHNDEDPTPSGWEASPSASQPILVVDDRRPDEVWIEGKPVRLQEKQFRMLRTLAAAPGECVPYETLYDAVWGDAVVESVQMHFQKRQIIQRIKEVAPLRSGLIRTIPKRGFLLELAPQEVALLPATVGNAA